MKLFFKYVLVYFLVNISEAVLFYKFILNTGQDYKGVLSAWLGLKLISISGFIYILIFLLFRLLFSLINRIKPLSNSIIIFLIAGILANMSLYILPFYENYTLVNIPEVHLPTYFINGIFLGLLFYFLKLESKEELQ